MAEGLLRHALDAGLPGVRVSSAGVAAAEGGPASRHTLAILEEAGIALGEHRSRQVTPEMVEEATLVLAMTEDHRTMLAQIAPDSVDRLFLLGEFSPESEGLDVPDPFGGGIDVYRETRDAIVAAIPGLIRFLRENLADSQGAAD